ncbi:MAG: hypothetical protein CMM50_02115 [Rhodospirillaceae bacterium]|nr:hypothetical protein [Rhodospirillaceae bacterium]
MRVDLLYGRGALPLELPDDWDVSVIRKRPMPAIHDPVAAVEGALASPVGAPPLAEAARGKKTACILICDITRPVPNGLILPVIVRTLLDAGVPAAGITVLVATGLHRPNEGEELAELVGDPWVLETVNVVNHFARNDDDHVEIGVTSQGTRIRLDKRFVEAELRIATGLVEPHFMAGYSGGRKVIAPGVAHAETITTFHSARFMENPLATMGRLDDNPLHKDQLEVVEQLGGALAMNTVIDEERRLAFVNYGEIVASHLKAVDFARRYTEVAIDRRFRTVITSSAGYPLDKTYYQTIKGMVAPVDILAPGGDMFVVSQCSEGMGSEEFVAAQRRLIELGEQRFIERITAQRYAEIDEWQTEMQLRATRIGEVHLFTEGLKGEARGLTGVTMVDDLGTAIRAAVARHGDKSVAVIPEGPYVVPSYTPDAVAAE